MVKRALHNNILLRLGLGIPKIVSDCTDYMYFESYFHILYASASANIGASANIEIYGSETPLELHYPQNKSVC